VSWYPLALPSHSGRRYLVTGANSGLGFFTAARLAVAGAHVVLSGRSPERLDAAVAAIRGARPAASVEALVMDQSSLDAVDAGADRLLAGPPLDGIVANAGMVHTPTTRLESIDGNELVLATNVLGHFALFERMLPHLADGARIVSLGSFTPGTRFSDALQAAWAQGKHRGAEIPLFALTAAGVEGGDFWGPKYLVRGGPTRQRPTDVSLDPTIGSRVWAFAEQATGRSFTVRG